MKITKTEYIPDGYIASIGGWSMIFKTVRKSEARGLSLWASNELIVGYINEEATPAALEMMSSLGIEVGEAKVYL